MTEPWATIWVVVGLAAAAAAAIMLLYWAVRWRSLALVLLCAAMVLWPVVADDVIMIVARGYVREAIEAEDGMVHFLWDDSPGAFLTKVFFFNNLVQSALVLAASIMTVRLLKREKSRQQPPGPSTSSDGTD